MKEGRSHAHQGKDFKRKDYFFDIINITNDQRRCAIDAFRKEIEDYQSGKKDKSKLKAALALRTPAGLEDNAENESVDGKHEHGVEE